MTHAFRKYLDKRGSALFMVLSLMTALMILVMAMYFSVVSSREVQYKVFYQEQAYRSATSLADAIVAGLGESKGAAWKTAEGSIDLTTAITELGVDESISTNGNGFISFSESGTKEDQEQLGAYNVTITRLKDEPSEDGTIVQVYDVAVTTSVGGVLDTTHTYLRAEAEIFDDPQGPTQTFTSTGYAPNDVFVDGGKYYTTTFFDNEYTIIGSNHEVGNQNKTYLYSDLHCGGTLIVNNYSPYEVDKPVTWAIRNDFYHYRLDTALKFGPSSSERGVLMVGHDAFLGDKNRRVDIDNCDIYVNGDLHIWNYNIGSDCRLFVNGDIIFEYGSNKVPSETYCNGTIIDNSSYPVYRGAYQNWDASYTEDCGFMSYKEMLQELDEATTSQTFYKWEINDTIEKDRDDYFGELNENGTNPAFFTVEFDTARDIDTVVIPWEPKTKTNYYGDGSLTYSAHIIKDVVDKGGATYDIGDGYTIIIDTGDDPKNQHILKVLPNCDFDSDGKEETFSWHPVVGITNAPAENLEDLNIIIRGRGSVVIDVPNTCIYQGVSHEWVIHESFFMLGGGTVSEKPVTDADGNSYTCQYFKRNETCTNKDHVLSLMHTECDEHCSLCNYDIDYKYGDCTQGDCDGNLVEMYCPEHDYTYIFCDKCGVKPDYNESPSGKKEYYGICENRVNRSAVDAKATDAIRDGKGVIYPTVNFFVISCDESADIRLSTGNDCDKNTFFGFVYAPYMTYKGVAKDNSDGVRFCGGMIVSDYILTAPYATINCMPEFLPTDLISAQARQDTLMATASKDWKITLGGY